jgi:hypothetical protein
MMDSLTIIGTASSVANVVELLGKTISVLRDFYVRWKDAEFVVLNLISQLTVLRAALSKIRDWIDADLREPQHHQLVMDLDTCLKYCKLLVSKIDSQVSELMRTPDDRLVMMSRMKVVFESKANEDLQKLIERQTGALTLLLTAFNW